jgi:hypothetical protein
MITLPATLTPVPKYHGYYWDVVEHKLYSIKPSGVLREMTLRHVWNGVSHKMHLPAGTPYYTISHKGQRKLVLLDKLMLLKLVDHEIPIVPREDTTNV